MSLTRRKKRPYVKAHNTNLNVYGIGLARVETLLNGETEAERIFKERKAQEEAEADVIRKEAQQQKVAKQMLHIQKKEEEAMSTLRESLEKAILEKEHRAAKLQATIDDWGDDEDAPAPVVNTINKETRVTITPVHTPTTISEGTFNFVRNNPSQTAKDIVARLHSVYGYNPTSTTSLISQMVRQGLIGRQDGLLYALVDSYKPIKSKDALIKQQEQQEQQEQQAPHKQVRITVRGEDINPPSKGIAALATKPDVTYNISSLLDNISVNEARALYLELKKLFGGN